MPEPTCAPVFIEGLYGKLVEGGVDYFFPSATLRMIEAGVGLNHSFRSIRVILPRLQFSVLAFLQCPPVLRNQSTLSDGRLILHIDTLMPSCSQSSLARHLSRSRLYSLHETKITR